MNTNDLEQEVFLFMKDTLTNVQPIEGWHVLGPRGKVIQPCNTPTTTKGEIATSKKRTILSSILEESVWALLKFPNTPPRRKTVAIWLITFTKCRNSTRYLSLLNGELQGTRITLPTDTEQSNKSLRTTFWNQMTADMERDVGLNNRNLANGHWDSSKWVLNWQQLDDGFHTYHVLILMEHIAEDDQFYIDESTHQWTIVEDLRIWISTDWDMDIDARFSLQIFGRSTKN